MDKTKFLREDWKTFKPKFIICCKDCTLEIKKYSETFVNVNKKN